MRIYPAIKAQMGDWNYYIVRMKMREVAQEVHLAHDIYEDKTLSDAVQRTLRQRRVKKEIVGFLSRRGGSVFFINSSSGYGWGTCMASRDNGHPSCARDILFI